MNTSSMVVARAEIEATVILLSLMSPRTAWQSRCRQMQLLDKRAQLHPQDMGQHWDTQIWSDQKWSEVISRREFPVYIRYRRLDFKEDSLPSATAFGLGGAGHHPGSCDELCWTYHGVAQEDGKKSRLCISESERNLSQEHAKINEIYEISMSLFLGFHFWRARWFLSISVGLNMQKRLAMFSWVSMAHDAAPRPAIRRPACCCAG